MTKLVYGVGFNDRKYPVFVNGAVTKSYNLWKSMLERCYSHKYHETRPTYLNCTVSDNFKQYTYFHEWVLTQIGYDAVGFHLDKDIIHRRNTTYSENTCAFVPSNINCFFSDSSSCRGKYLIGVKFHQGRSRAFETRCWSDGRRKSLGYFQTSDEAYQAYKTYKEQLCKDLANKWKEQIDPRVYSAMMLWTVENF